MQLLVTHHKFLQLVKTVAIMFSNIKLLYNPPSRFSFPDFKEYLREVAR